MALQQIITFVFSDIEHSTRLAQQLHDRYPELLERHRSVIRSAIKKYKGREIDTAGDGFFMTFENPDNAVLAAATIQKEFYTHQWATEIGLKVRIGLHTGIALTTQTGYTGVEVHFAARICHAAYGGQVLISNATQQCLEGGYKKSASLIGLGAYLLKDFANAVDLFQLNIPGVESHFPEPRVNPDEKKIAVLPFSTANKDESYDYIGHGVAEEIIVALGKVKGLRVMSRSAAFAIKGAGFDPQQIGQKLQVHSVLEGWIEIFKGRMRISAELVETDSGLNIWSGQFDSSTKDLMQIQHEITHKITQALKCTLIPEHQEAMLRRQTNNPEAYDYYLRGRRFYLYFTNRGIKLALRMFEKAIIADSTYALAYAGIADCYSFQYQHKERSKELIDKADKASTMAASLAPDLAEVYMSRGIVLGLRQQLDEAEKSFHYAIEQDPTLFLGWFHYGRTCFTAGKLDKAARLFEQANRVEPDDYQSILLSANAYDDINCIDLAQTLRERGVSIAEKWLELNHEDTRALYFAANGYAFLGNREKSLSLIRRALALDPADSLLLYNAGCVFALLSMKSEALNCLEGAHKAGLTLLGWYENDSNLKSIKDEPRFIKLLEKMRDQ